MPLGQARSAAAPMSKMLSAGWVHSDTRQNGSARKGTLQYHQPSEMSW